MVPDETISEIKSRLSIVDAVSEYVSLKRAGQAFVGLCPFHKEKTPSFSVHPARQCFHCFGCHMHGDIFTFVSTVEGLSFPQTLEKLASRAGIALTRQPRKEKTSLAPQLVQAYETLEWAAKYYQFLLTKRPEGKLALDYLKHRGIGPKTIERFRLGYAPDGWTGLRNAMLKRGFSESSLVFAGLISAHEKKSYDRFRHRLIFPITDKEGRAIGFGARALKDTDQPKYLNSPDSQLFSKRENLYGLFENNRGIRLRGEAVIVEGYMDVIGLWEHGIDNAVAVMGTAVSEVHCRHLRQLTARVITVFDPDAAGEDAWHSSMHTLMEAGLVARDVTLPPGQDPDDFVRSSGAEAFYSACEKAPRQITKWLKEIASRGQLGEKGRTQILHDMSPLLRATRKLPDRLTLWDDISLLLGVSTTVLGSLSEGQSMVHKPSGKGPEPKRSSATTANSPRYDPLEMAFVEASLYCLESLRAIPPDGWKTAVTDTGIIQLLERLHASEEAQVIDILQEYLNPLRPIDQLSATVSAFLVGTNTAIAEHQQAFKDTLSRLRGRRVEREIQCLTAQAKISQRMGNETAALELLGKIRELRGSLPALTR